VKTASRTWLWWERCIFWVWRYHGLQRAQRVFAGAPHPCILERKLSGYRFGADVSRSDTQRLLYLTGERLVEERFLVRQLAKGKRNAVDVGANIGYYLLMFRRFCAPGARITCVEPSEENLPELEWNIRANGFDDVALHRVAAGPEHRRAHMRSGINSGVVEPGNGTHEVEMVRLDDVLPTGIDFLKIDIEGYEHSALLGATTVLERDHPVLFLELHPHTLHRYGASVSACLEILCRYYSDLTYYGADFSLGAQGKHTRRLVHRVVAPYLPRDPVARLHLGKDDLARLDAGEDWGTLWLVCR